jgi:Inner membrane protein YgaP-like, transmembrane domain
MPNPVESISINSLATKGVSAMKVNVGNVDRIVRIVAGLALIGLAVAGTIGPWGYIGIVPLLTGLTRVCPAYSLVGVDTCSTGKK